MSNLTAKVEEIERLRTEYRLAPDDTASRAAWRRYDSALLNAAPALIADWKRLKAERDVMAALIQTMIDRDPDEIIYIADVGGGPLLDEWRNRARKALESSK